MTLPDTNFLLTLLPIALAAVVAAIVVVAAFSWLNTSRRAEKAETEAEQLRLEKDQEHVAKHLALSERDNAVNAFRVRDQEFSELEARLTDARALAAQSEASFRAEQQRRIELERLTSARDGATLALSGALTATGAQLEHSTGTSIEKDEALTSLTSDVERARAELEVVRAELMRKDVRLAEMDALKRQLDEKNAKLVDAMATAQNESRKVAEISAVAGSALLLESQLNEARARVGELERLAADREDRLRRAEAAPFTSAGDEAAAHVSGLRAEISAAHGRIDALNEALARRDAQLAAHQAEVRRITSELNTRNAAPEAAPVIAADMPVTLIEAQAALNADLERELQEARAELAALRARPASLSEVPGPVALAPETLLPQTAPTALGAALAPPSNAQLLTTIERDLTEARAELAAARINPAPTDESRQLAELERELSEARAELAAAQSAPASSAGAQHLAELEKELGEARTELANLKAERGNLPDPGHAAALERELAEARSELARRGAEMAELHSKVSAAEAAPPAANTSDHAALAERDRVIANLTAELNTTRQQASVPLVATDSELAQLKSAVETARADAADQDARITLLREDLNSAHAKIAALGEEKSALETSLAKAVDDSHTAAARLSAMAATVGALESQIQDVRDQFEREHAQAQRAASSLKAAEARFVELSGAASSMAALSAQVADARARSVALEQVVADRERRIEGLSAQVAQADRALSDRAAALDDARDQARMARAAMEAPAPIPESQTETAETQGARPKGPEIERLVAAGAEKDQQIATMRRQLDESMSSLRRAMSELAARDLQLTRAAVRLEEQGDAATRSSAPPVAPSGLGTFEASAPIDGAISAPATTPPPDALEEIIGIGPTIARRLRLAGIKTYKQIAESTPDQLEEIARLPDWRKSNFKAWIEQARKLAGES